MRFQLNRIILSKIALKIATVKAYFHNIFIHHYLVYLNYMNFAFITVGLTINSTLLILSSDDFLILIFVLNTVNCLRIAISILRPDQPIRNMSRVNRILSKIPRR